MNQMNPRRFYHIRFTHPIRRGVIRFSETGLKTIHEHQKFGKIHSALVQVYRKFNVAQEIDILSKPFNKDPLCRTSESRNTQFLPVPQRKSIDFTWQGKPYTAQEGETIAAALFANGIRVFGHHPKDQSPLGLFCANGQCSQCMVIANGSPVKSCMELIQSGMSVDPNDGLPVLPLVTETPEFSPIPEIEIPVLIIGGGPAGLSAAIELGKSGIKTLLVDDKHRLGGKLVLQTHRFFGSTDAVYAGTRGIDIATRLEKEVSEYPTVEVWLQSTCLGVFSDKKIGILRNGEEYTLVKPEMLLVASGAREKFLAFKGNTLPGVYGAGAFQTLVNRDLIRPAEKLFIVGGGNVGLIAGYHALQAGIGVVGLVEALPECGGYKVHKDKLARMGVPIYTSHTVLSANGTEKVESVTVAEVDAQFTPIPGTEKSFECDSVLIAVGLDPVNEFYLKARDFGLTTFSAGDAEEIAEASAAIFSGKIKGREIAKTLGNPVGDVPTLWYRTGEILKSKPGSTFSEVMPDLAEGVLPVIHCSQEIPCNPCAALCPNGLIIVDKKDIRAVPTFVGNNFCCAACERCVAGCPGLGNHPGGLFSRPQSSDCIDPIRIHPGCHQRKRYGHRAGYQGRKIRQARSDRRAFDYYERPNHDRAGGSGSRDRSTDCGHPDPGSQYHPPDAPVCEACDG